MSSSGTIDFDIADLCGNELDGYIHYLTGATPKSLSALVLRVANGWAPDVYVGFRNLCIIAATTHRNKVMDYLKRPGNASLSAEIKKHFYVCDRVNFSYLNLIGHMVIAATGKTEHRRINHFRKRCGGESIWHADLERSKFSEAQRRICKEKVGRFSVEEAVRCGREIASHLTNARSLAIAAAKNGNKSGTGPTQHGN